MKKQHMVYLAGPHFNEDELSLIDKLKKAVEKVGYKTYHPCRDAPMPEGGTGILANRQHLYDKNLDNMLKCDTMVAVLNWTTAKGRHNEPVPDVGTIWEIGFASRCVGIKNIIGLYSNPKFLSGGINLMLERSLTSLVLGEETFFKTLSKEKSLECFKIGIQGLKYVESDISYY